MTAASSSSFSDLAVSWAARTEDQSGGKTSPEELLASAHASCFSMALSAQLGRNGTPPQKLEVTAAVTFDKPEGASGFKVTRSELEVRGTVPNIDAAKFAELAEAAKDGCPISQALKGNVDLSVEAELAS